MNKESRHLYLVALVITIFLMSTVFMVGWMLDRARVTRINDLGVDMISNLNEMQTFMLMSETYGDAMACLAFKSKLLTLDRSVWDLGMKIDQYRVASEEFFKDPFYREQKKTFNEYQLFYLLLLTKVSTTCKYDQKIVSFFYQNSIDCKKCDDQSFVLTDLKEQYGDAVSIFSFDTELNITSIKLLTEFYNITEFPCIVIDGKTHCDIQDKRFIEQELCGNSTNVFCDANV